MDIPTTRLPIVKSELFAGIHASDDFNPSNYLGDLMISNPWVWRFICESVLRMGEEYGEDAADVHGQLLILMYRMLETQAECDELGE